MEYGLWRIQRRFGVVASMVLILVLMEYGLWQVVSGGVRRETMS